IAGGINYLVNGDYLYYHYMQDNFNDNGWGCAYRTLQTIISWFYLQNYESPVKNRINVPSHKQIQTCLVELKDKPNEFINSNQWIGAIEVGMVFDYWCGMQSKTLFINSGKEVIDYT